MTGPTPRLLRIISRIVPADRRDVWGCEWSAEFSYHRQDGRRHTRAWTAARLLAATQHALWLRIGGGPARRAPSGPRGPLWIGLGDDVRTTLRGWRRAPVFSTAVLLTLALGVGLFSAVLSFADGYLFRPLPFPGADRTYYVSDPHARIADALSATDVVALRQSPVAEFGFVEWSSSSLMSQMTIDGRPIDVFAYEVGPGFRDTLLVPLAAGRDFQRDDHVAGGPVSAWLSYRFWLHEFSGDWSVVGRRFPAASFRGTSIEVRVVGILAPQVATFDLNNRPPDLVVAAQGPAIVGPNRLAFPLALLPEGVTVEQATGRISAALQAAAPSAAGGPRIVKLESFAGAQVSGGRPTAKLLFAGVVLIFVLAGMNLVHLLLGRSASRAADVATRVALGASRWRIVRAFIVESALLGLVGTAAGLLLGSNLSTFLAARVPQLPTGGRNLSMVPMIFDSRIMAISAVAGLLTAAIGGLWPARHAWRGSLLARTGTNAGLSRRVARLILASELTVVTMVAVGVVFAGLGVYRYLNQPLGYDYRDRARVDVRIPGKRFAGADAVTALDAVRAVAGVRAAGLETVRVPDDEVSVPGRAIKASAVSTSGISDGLFEAWGMKLRNGRWFDTSAFAGGDSAVVDERFARMAWPDADAIGQSVRTGSTLRTVIGVVESQRWRLDGEVSPTVFVPIDSASARAPIVLWAPGVDDKDLRERVTQAVAVAVPGAKATVTPTAFDTLFARGVGEARFQVPFVIAFGALAGVLAIVGVFGIVSFLVLQRTREFGVRIALGASRLDIVRAVLRDSVGPAIAGLVIGSAGARASASVVESTIFGWQSSGVLTIALVAGAILAVAVIAALAPAARASKIDPAVSLRVE